MSRHGRGGKRDPYAKYPLIGEYFGTWEVSAHLEPHPHYGLRVAVRCIHCGQVRTNRVALLRNQANSWHFGCSAPRRKVSPQLSLGQGEKR